MIIGGVELLALYSLRHVLKEQEYNIIDEVEIQEGRNNGYDVVITTGDEGGHSLLDAKLEFDSETRTGAVTLRCGAKLLGYYEVQESESGVTITMGVPPEGLF